MRSMHLFAGAGGGLLADLILGHTPVCAVELDSDCCKVLNAKKEDGWFPSLHVHEGDIRLFDPSDWAGGVDCIHAGFPCQDISAANPNGEGINGNRSGLVWEVFRIVDMVKPKFVFFENSPRIRTKGRREIISALVARRYAWRDGILAASDVGAPHERKRWWLLAANADGIRELQHKRCEQNIRRWVGDCTQKEDVADSVRKRCENGCRGTAAETIENKRRPIDMVSREASAAKQTPWFEVEPSVGELVYGMADGLVPVSKAIKALGNGQVPLQAAAAWVLLGGPVGWEQ